MNGYPLTEEIVETIIEQAYADYQKVIEKKARQLFTAFILPFLRRRKYTFLSGNGTWYMEDSNGKHISGGDHWLDDDDETPDEELNNIVRILDVDVTGTWNCFGAYMPNYTP